MKNKLKLMKSHLMIPVAILLNKDSIDDIKYRKNRHELMKDVYSLEVRKAMHEALKWAEENPDFQFKSCLEGTPITGSIKVNNEDIYEHLMRYKAYMENEEYGLLTDDRSTNPPWERD